MAINKLTTDGVDMSSNTGGLTWAKGTTSEQPAAGSSLGGDMRFNITTKKLELFNGAAWKDLAVV